MKQIILYIIIGAAALMAPVERMDVGKLRPVELVEIYRENEKVIIATDTGDWGEGTDPEEALRDLKETTSGYIYLDTARFVLAGEESDKDIEMLRSRLKPSVRLCRIKKRINPQKAAAYLRVHRDLPELKKWKIGETMPFLEQNEEKLKILKKDEKSG